MLTYLDLFDDRRIAVIGDLMLDCYMAGDVTRISPEAPVPVIRVSSEKTVPGGAANVAANLATLGIAVSIVGIAGADTAREELIEELLARGNVDCAGVIAVPGRRTTRKLRIIGARQQIVRVDQEDIGPCDAATSDRFIEAAFVAIADAEIVVLSDYGKGVCSDRVLRAVIDHARRLAKPVIVDPKRLDLTAYRGAAVLTPNRKELTDATGLPCESDEEAEIAARRARALCGADILLTRSEKGMSYFPMTGEPLHIPTAAQDIFDVSGAGDTVVAVLAASMAAGMPFADGMRMANHAAGIVVSKVGTASVTRDELAAALGSEHADPDVHDGRLLDREAAAQLRAAWAREKLSVGFTNGCFDLVHPGHVSLIRQAADHCDRLIVAINSDASVGRLKGPARPIQDETSRAAVIGAIKGVAAVTIFDEETPKELIQRLQPDLLVKGADYTIDRVVGADMVQARGGRVLLVDLSEGHSTSRLVARSTPAAQGAMVE